MFTLENQDFFIPACHELITELADEFDTIAL